MLFTMICITNKRIFKDERVLTNKLYTLQIKIKDVVPPLWCTTGHRHIALDRVTLVETVRAFQQFQLNLWLFYCSIQKVSTDGEDDSLVILKRLHCNILWILISSHHSNFKGFQNIFLHPHFTGYRGIWKAFRNEI